MAIKTGDIFNSLTFGGINSADYGIYITGEAVYNAPERAIELVSVPGRNGAIAIDQGRWENIVVSYPAGTFETDQAKFALAMAAFRGALASKTGYQRLTDTYNSNEFRMGMFVDGIEVSPVQNKAGEFTISFNCKPQRWLTSGETAWTMAGSSDSLTNPTLFHSNPLLEVTGYGNITMNGQTISIDNGQTGNIALESVSAEGGDSVTSLQISVGYSQYSSTVNAGDSIIGRFYTKSDLMCKRDPNNDYYKISSIDGVSSGLVGKSFIDYDNLNLTAFPSSTQTYTFTSSYAIVLSNSTSFTLTVTRTITNSTSGTITMSVQVATSSNVSSYVSHYISKAESQNMVIHSTYSGLGNPTYIDLDLGEAYKISNGEVVSLNNLVSIPATMPTLKPGINLFTKYASVTQLKVVPRWWQL